MSEYDPSKGFYTTETGRAIHEIGLALKRRMRNKITNCIKETRVATDEIVSQNVCTISDGVREAIWRRAAGLRNQQ
jgi:CRISPR/Cas system type I-B associated protein Csh2 (Cas7 group RAMP superfamily)